MSQLATPPLGYNKLQKDLGWEIFLVGPPMKVFLQMGRNFQNLAHRSCAHHVRILYQMFL